MRAYILVQTGVGKAFEVADQVRTIDGVVQTDDVTGPYDIIVTVDLPDVIALGRLVQTRLGRIDGVTRTVTCPVVD